jgi:hypothetical protein
MSIKKRESSRYYAHWRIAIVFDEAEKMPAIHGHTHDLSISGASVHTDHHVASNMPVTVLLSPPLAYEGERQKVIEIRAELVYSVYSGSNFCFRIGLHFIKFKNDDLQILKGMLDNQSGSQ